MQQHVRLRHIGDVAGGADQRVHQARSGVYADMREAFRVKQMTKCQQRQCVPHRVAIEVDANKPRIDWPSSIASAMPSSDKPKHRCATCMLSMRPGRSVGDLARMPWDSAARSVCATFPREALINRSFLRFRGFSRERAPFNFLSRLFGPPEARFSANRLLCLRLSALRTLFGFQ